MFADLHTHTSASDGTLTSYELVHLAKSQGLAAIAITDHDTVDGIESGLAASEQLGLKVVPGIELSTQVEACEVHILGYYIDYKDKTFVTALEKFTSARINRGKKIVSKLKELGLLLNWESILARSGEGSIGRPHIASALLEKGYVDSIEEAFYKYLNFGAPAYVPRLKISPQEAINLIKETKGVPILAHPGLIRNAKLVRMLVSWGLMGIEVNYPLHTHQDIQYYSDLCRRNNLLATGGSDFHGIGTDFKKRLGLSAVNYEVVEKLEMLRGL